MPADFEDREELEEFLSDMRGRRVEIATPQRGAKKALLDLVETNAKHSFDQRFRELEAVFEGDGGGFAGRAESSGSRRAALNASTSRTFREPTRWRAWWFGKTAR